MYIKKGVRILGIAESFYKEWGKSILVGIVQRGDLIIDGFSYAQATVGGMDATNAVIELYEDLDREDINYIMMSGAVISWYNVIDLNKVYLKTGRPVISLTYEETEGIVRYFIENFPRDWHYRLLIHLKNGERKRIKLKNGYDIYMRVIGLDEETAVRIINMFTLEGKYPEPVRIARLIARRIARKQGSGKKYL